MQIWQESKNKQILVHMMSKILSDTYTFIPSNKAKAEWQLFDEYTTERNAAAVFYAKTIQSYRMAFPVSE